jgi:hypothetical protein
MKQLSIVMFAVLIISLIPACNRETANEGVGRLIVNVTDAPFPIDIIESAMVTITKVEIRKVGDGDEEGRPFITISEEPATFNLFELRNGIVEKFLDLELPEGEYDLIRLYVDNASLKIKEGGDYNVKVPGGAQTGIKIFINPGITISGGLTSELLLDFDISRSFIVQGNPFTPAGIKGFIFKPVIRAVNNTTAGRIEGMVTDTTMVKIINASVWLKKDTIITRTFTDTLGRYAIIGIPAGDYSLHATKENYDTVSLSAVKVFIGNRTTANFKLTPRN